MASAVQVQQQHHLATADFPSARAFSNILANFGLKKFPKVAEKHLRAVDEALDSDIPKLVHQFTGPN
jgi:hypothetical protein